jgi:hypothetical protein
MTTIEEIEMLTVQLMVKLIKLKNQQKPMGKLYLLPPKKRKRRNGSVQKDVTTNQAGERLLDSNGRREEQATQTQT